MLILLLLSFFLEVRPLFVPGDDVTAQLVVEIGKAKKSVKMQAYNFTDQSVADAMIAARKRGVNVYVIADRKEGHKPYSKNLLCHQNGIGVRLDGKHAIHHNKIIIVDDNLVITGSFNFSVNAQKRNAENVVIISKEPTVAREYREHWQQHWEHSEDFGTR